MKRTLLNFVLLFSLVIFVAAIIDTTGNGNWGATGTWVGGSVPTAADDAVIKQNDDIIVRSPNSYSVNSVDMEGNTTLEIETGASLIIGAGGLTALVGATIIVDGDLTINGDFVVDNNLDLQVTGNLIINGNVELKNGAGLNVTGGGSIDINGNFSADNNADISVVGGTVNVDGDFSVGGGTTSVSGDPGSISIGGTCSDASNPGPCDDASILPIKLLSFSGRTTAEGIQLKWVTSKQENFDYFELQHSSDGLNYSAIAKINGVDGGYSSTLESYNFEHKMPISGRNYYRLKAVDLDETYEIHEVIGVEFNHNNDFFRIYPNPASQGQFNLMLSFMPEEALSVFIYDLNGNLIHSSELPKNHNISFDLSSKIKGKGLYQILLRSESGWQASRKLMVN